MKKVLVIAYRSMLLLLLLLVFQSTVHAQQQTKKGRWFIKHNVGGFQLKTDEQRIISSAGVLLSLDRQRQFGFFTLLCPVRIMATWLQTILRTNSLVNLTQKTKGLISP